MNQADDLALHPDEPLAGSVLWEVARNLEGRLSIPIKSVLEMVLPLETLGWFPPSLVVAQSM